MDSVRIILSGLWVAMMLTFLLGDVMRLFAGHMTPGEMDGQEATQAMWLGAAAIMLIPIIMVVLSLTVPYPAIRWVSISASVLFVLFNLAGLPYVGWYDNFLIAVSFVFNGLIIWYAWTWASVSAQEPDTGHRILRSGEMVASRAGEPGSTATRRFGPVRPLSWSWNLRPM